MRRFVVVEGLIGVGKTSLCGVLAEAWGARQILEPSERNPFLEPYYEDPTRYAFPVQLFYLMSRWRQQDAIRQTDLFTEVVVSDYLFAKDRLFAEKTLSEPELEIYDRFAGVLGERAPKPDLVVLLDAPTPLLMERIQRRSAPGEWAITAEYLEDLRERYARLFGAWRTCPVLRIDNRAMNYVDGSAGRAEVLDLVESALRGAIDPNTPGSIVDREVQSELFGAGS